MFALLTFLLIKKGISFGDNVTDIDMVIMLRPETSAMEPDHIGVTAGYGPVH